MRVSFGETRGAMNRWALWVGVLAVAVVGAVLLGTRRGDAPAVPPTVDRAQKTPQPEEVVTPVAERKASSAVPDSPLPSTILGEVVDAVTGEAVAAFDVRVIPPGRGRRAETVHFEDAAGVFELVDVPPGNITLAFSALGYAELERHYAAFERGEIVAGLRVALEPVGSIAGRVIGPAGEAVAGARIFLHEIPPAALREIRTVTTTDEAGAFTLSEVSVRTTTIAAAHSDYSAKVAEVSLRQFATNDVVLELGYGASVVGRVTRNGAPVYFQTVLLLLDEGEGEKLSVQTDEDGWYRFDGVSYGSATIALSAHRYGDVPARWIRRPVELEFGGEVRADIELSVSAGLRGRVHSEFAAPPGRTDRGPYITIAETDGSRSSFSTEIQPDGSFEFPHLPAGVGKLRYRLYDGYNSTLRETVTELLPRQTTWVDIYPDTGALLLISVSNLHPLVSMCSFRLWRLTHDTGATQELTVWSGALHRPNAATAIEGELRWPEPTVIEARFLPPGEYTLELSASFWSPEATIDDPLTASMPIQIDRGERYEAHIALPDFTGDFNPQELANATEVHMNPDGSRIVVTLPQK